MGTNMSQIGLVGASPESRPMTTERPNRFVQWVDKVFRFELLGFIHYLVLLGVASVTELAGRPAPGLGVLLQVLLVAWLFHLFAYLFNDVIDLPVDRTQPQRASDPLVRGDLDVRWALAASLATLPAACAMTWWIGGGRDAQLVLLAAFGAMAIYDVWGKRCFFPPLTDLAQGVGWSLMLFWAALTLEHQLTAWSWVLGLGAALFVFQVNGVHASLRDLDNDLRAGCFTAAILLGSRPRPHVEGACCAGMTRPLAVYALAGQLVGAVFAVWALILGPFSWISTLAVSTSILFNFWLMVRVLDVDRPTWQVDFRMHLFFNPLPPLVACIPLLSPYLLTTLALAFVLPVLTHKLVLERTRKTWALLASPPARCAG